MRQPTWIWRDRLPADCPPREAVEPSQTFYRIAKTNPPSEGDFVPIYDKNRRHAERSIARRAEITLCAVMGLSVFSDIGRAESQIRQMPRIGGYIMALSLDETDGHVVGFPDDPFHYTFWPNDGFDPIAASRLAMAVET